jgi:hypothetical protein
VYSATAFLKVVAHKRLAAGDDYKHLAGICALGDAFKNAEEVFLWHGFLVHYLPAVAPAMTTMHVASQGALPEQLSERVIHDVVVPDHPRHLQCHALLEV